jgi:hypothetical protein
VKTLGPIFLCDKAPDGETWKAVEPGDPCPFCQRPLADHKTASDA